MIKDINEKIPVKYMLLLILLAYGFSFAIRMIWVWQFQDNPNFLWDGQIMINTNDGYYFAAGAQQALEGMHLDNPRIPTIWAFGTVSITTFLVKITPFSLETITLYMPAIISSIVVVPMILIGRLYNQALWGFFAALLGSITWSYYNRTMIGYYDTDMFSAMAPMFILYFFIKSTIDFNLRSALYAALFISIYPFLYDQGKTIVYAMGMIYALYMIFYHRKEETTYQSLILLFIALLPLPFVAPYIYFVKVAILLLVYMGLQKLPMKQKNLMFLSGGLFLLFLIFGNMFTMILGKMMSYISTGTATEGLHFYGVKQTIREAGSIPFSTFANRISGSQIGLIFSLVGYVFLVMRHRTFVLALPLVGIGIFALWGGLRFTVYAVPMAAMASIYLFFVLGGFFKNNKFKYGFIIFATAAMLYPNIQHIIGYKVPTVLNKAEVADLDKLKNLSNPKDYTLTWWDYGYPIWYYSETSTLIDGGKHNNDNFIISQIMQTTSADLAANFSRIAVEEYSKSSTSYKQYRKNGAKEEDIPEKYRLLNNNGNIYHGGRGAISNVLFRNGQEDQHDPELFLEELESDTYSLPKKTRDIYLYLPYRMMNIYPTVAIFGNLNLNTGEKKKKITFYPSSVKSNTKNIITLHNGIVFDSKKGEVTIGGKVSLVKNFIGTQNTKTSEVRLNSKLYHIDGAMSIIYMKSYGKFIVMDIDTFNSMYVQMFILGKYDKNLFELVVSSAYSKIYKLKK